MPAVKPTLAVINARIWTGNPRQPWADGLVATDDRFTLVGSSAEVRKAVPRDANIIDAQGMFVAPGFIDAHVHFLDGGLALASVQLGDVTTREAFVQRIADHTSRVAAGAWITHGHWDHEHWGGELPSRDWIDAVTPRHPVWVDRHDIHMALANSAALRLAGVSRDTPDPPGGTIVRDVRGEPTGILKDNAQQLVARVVPPPSAAQEDAALDAAMRYVAANGVTSVHNMGLSWADLPAFERAQASGRLRTRIYAAVPLADWERLRDRVATQGRGDAWLRVSALKGFVDGSLGSHTAAMLAPFTDAPNDTGLLVNDPDDLYRWTSAADKAGLHVIVHAIGDRAVRLQLDVFEHVARENGARDRRFRIEHAQHVSPADLPRFAQNDVIASMQPYHAIDDGQWAERVIGAERAQTTYPVRSLLDSGARIAFGSDWPVAPATPLEGIYAAVTRRTLDGAHPDGWIPEQRIGVEEALRAYTRNAAFASFDESEKGTIERGKLADFVMIDGDVTRLPPEEVRSARVTMTVVGGRAVFAADD
jgi:predicted amidohydrolase YtcJ